MSGSNGSNAWPVSRRALLGAAGLAAIPGRLRAQTAGAAVIGKEGWLFPIWDKTDQINTRELTQTLNVMGQTAGILRSAGIATAYVLAPSKARTYRQYLPNNTRISADIDRRYATAVAEMRKAGAIVPDLDAAFRARANDAEGLFFKTDTHWTPLGAELAAAETAKAVAQANVLPASSRPGLQLQPAMVKTQGRGDLVRNLPEAQRQAYGPERYQIREPVAATGAAALVADDSADVAVIGNSYSQPLYGFHASLSNQMNRPVSLFWKPNNFGPYNILLSYLASEGFKRQRPKLITWVQLEFDLPGLPTSSGWGQNAISVDQYLADLRRAVGA
ncbi:hypothetical protein J8J14_04510 [Roseomonas sp. SSH11]|uniref:AlgX/AlgJ SGNH hydrolase-like domain-containing protein n=1 Tax=Pararoseomonas baculiformis TaxID=2820812 RepID=A0ABS4AAJ7_9PROT|nr:hypothetical protein [Pararoseomonas baculiformis]MBP0444032.1 hypothetical protein [Pararoseomonas baculiformis]